eukprot:gene8826-775_t
MLKRKTSDVDDVDFIFPPTKRRENHPNFEYLFPTPQNHEALKFFITPRMAFSLYIQAKFIFETMTMTLENLSHVQKSQDGFFEILLPKYVVQKANKIWMTQFSICFQSIYESLQHGIIPKPMCMADSIALYRVVVHAEIEHHSGQFLKYFGDFYCSLQEAKNNMDLKFVELFEFFFLLDNSEFLDFVENEDEEFLSTLDINNWFKPYL